MSTAWTSGATLAVGSGALNATNFIATDVVSANLAVRNVATVAESQSNLAAAGLTGSAKTGSRTAQLYSLIMQPTFAAQSDAVQVLAFLLAAQASSSAAAKYQAVETIRQVVEVATQALDEIYGLRPMPLHRPDQDQVSALIRQIATARAAIGLAALPALKQQ
jgi:hypothetical protein